MPACTPTSRPSDSPVAGPSGVSASHSKTQSQAQSAKPRDATLASTSSASPPNLSPQRPPPSPVKRKETAPLFREGSVVSVGSDGAVRKSDHSSDEEATDAESPERRSAPIPLPSLKAGQSLLDALRLLAPLTPQWVSVLEKEAVVVPDTPEDMFSALNRETQAGQPKSFRLHSGSKTIEAYQSKLLPQQQTAKSSAKAGFRKKGTFYKAPSAAHLRPGGKRLCNTPLPGAVLELTDAETQMFATQERLSGLSKSAHTTLSAHQLEEWEELARQSVEHVDVLEGLLASLLAYLLVQVTPEGETVKRLEVRQDLDPHVISATVAAMNGVLSGAALASTSALFNVVLARRDAFFDVKKLAPSVDSLREDARILPMHPSSLFGPGFATTVEASKQRYRDDSNLQAQHSIVTKLTKIKHGAAPQPSAGPSAQPSTSAPRSFEQRQHGGRKRSRKGKRPAQKGQGHPRGLNPKAKSSQKSL